MYHLIKSSGLRISDKGVMDGLELDATNDSLDGEVDGRAVGTLLGAYEGVE